MTKAPNRALHAAMTEAGVSNKGLAKRVHDLASRDGVSIAADHVSVRRWLGGTTPRGHTARYIVAVLGEKLGRVVTARDLGFDDADAQRSPLGRLQATEYLQDAGTATEALARLTLSDVENSSGAVGAAWDSEAVPVFITRYLFADSVAPPASSTTDLGRLDATAVSATTAHLMQLDFQLGGGHTRELLLFFFRHHVLPLLQDRTGAPSPRELLRAAAELTQLLGWSAYDAGRHGAAQRYFVYGLRLAREAGDPMLVLQRQLRRVVGG